MATARAECNGLTVRVAILGGRAECAHPPRTLTIGARYATALGILDSKGCKVVPRERVELSLSE